MKNDNNIDENDIWFKSMERYHRYMDHIYMHRRLINPQLYKSGRDYQLKHAEQLFKEWFIIFDYWFGLKRKISSIEEFNMIADLMGY